MDRGTLARCAGALSLAAALAVRPASAASTIPASAWDAWAASTPTNHCFASFPPFSPLAAPNTKKARTWSTSTGAVVLDDATYEKVAAAGLATTRFATTVVLPKSGFQGTVFGAERQGAYLAWSIAEPGGTTDGFLPATGAPAQIASGTGTAVEALRRSIPATVTHARGQRRCGYTLVPISDARYSGEASGSAAVLLKNGHAIGFVETEGP